MKKFTTLALATAMVAAMGCTTFADGLMSKTGNDSSAEKYVIDFSGLSEEQVGAIVKIEADITVDSEFCNGTIGANIDGNWTSLGEAKIEAASGTWSWALEGSLVAKDDAGNLAPYGEVQFWWVNPMYDEEGNEGDAGTATLTAVRLLDANGADVRDAAPAPAPDADASADVAPIAFLASVIAVAGIAMVASKKRA